MVFSQQSILSTICQFLNVDCTYTPSSPIIPAGTWSAAALGALAPPLSILLIALFLHFYMPNRASRSATLFGLIGCSISSLYVCVLFPTMVHAMYSETVSDFLITLYLPLPFIILLLFISICLIFRSTLHIPFSFLTALLSFLINIIISLITLYLLPQHSKCTFGSLLGTISSVFVVSAYFSIAFNCFIYFLKMVNSEKLSIENGGYLKKKGSEWVEVEEKVQERKRRVVFVCYNKYSEFLAIV